MFTFKDIMYKVFSDILKVQIWTICSELTVRKLSQVAHRLLWREKIAANASTVVFMCISGHFGYKIAL